jgi:hypothetical protein
MLEQQKWFNMPDYFLRTQTKEDFFSSLISAGLLEQVVGEESTVSYKIKDLEYTELDAENNQITVTKVPPRIDFDFIGSIVVPSFNIETEEVSVVFEDQRYHVNMRVNGQLPQSMLDALPIIEQPTNPYRVFA